MRSTLASLVIIAAVGLLTGCSDDTLAAGTPVTPPLRSIVVVKNSIGHGTGMIIGPGLVLTAYHVVRGKGRPDVRFLNGHSNTGKVIWSEPERDLALVTVDIPQGHPAAGLDCADPIPGQHVVAVGHPKRSEWISASGHLPQTSNEHRLYTSLGFRVSRGVSGGPVFNDDGEVIGIVLAILANRASALTGIGFMLPASDFCETIQQKQEQLMSKRAELSLDRSS